MIRKTLIVTSLMAAVVTMIGCIVSDRQTLYRHVRLSPRTLGYFHLSDGLFRMGLTIGKRAIKYEPRIHDCRCDQFTNNGQLVSVPPRGLKPAAHQGYRSVSVYNNWTDSIQIRTTNGVDCVEIIFPSSDQLVGWHGHGRVAQSRGWHGPAKQGRGVGRAICPPSQSRARKEAENEPRALARADIQSRVLRLNSRRYNHHTAQSSQNSAFRTNPPSYPEGPFKTAWQQCIAPQQPGATTVYLSFIRLPSWVVPLGFLLFPFWALIRSIWRLDASKQSERASSMPSQHGHAARCHPTSEPRASARELASSAPDSQQD